jgi:hypothetical protein
MNQSQSEVYRNISKIIERDSKSTTYKFALLRATIDVIQENTPFIDIRLGRVHIPVGLLVEKWLVYYYPIIEFEIPIPQIHGATNLAFETSFRPIINYYKSRGGFSVFFNDLRNKGVPEKIESDFRLLVRQVRQTIINMPMKYLGRSLSDEYYSVYRKEDKARSGKAGTLDRQSIITNNGTFSIPIDYYDAFSLLGSFIGGQESILFKWAQFSVNAGSGLSTESVLERVLQSPVTERDVLASKRIYRDMLGASGSVTCVWSGSRLTSYDIDHVIPFSIWKNNDLWNLLPSSSKVNAQKRDKIPSPDTIHGSRNRIIEYWNKVSSVEPLRFQKEIQGNLIGYEDYGDWQNKSIDQLQKNCAQLIENRGFQSWSR